MFISNNISGREMFDDLQLNMALDKVKRLAFQNVMPIKLSILMLILSLYWSSAGKIFV